ncbi:MAG: methylated-DNA--[protein]-cysteine S-methyltransferase [Calditrichia bacterium]
METYRYLDSPLGPLLLAGRGEILQHIFIPREKEKANPDSSWVETDDCLVEAARQLTAYFSGSLETFSLQLDPQGTDFQKKVWGALQSIPFGKTISYGQLAMNISQPTASRAVGMANGKNPIPIIIPCHRVIGQDGSLTGFSSGLAAKRLLLKLEQNPEGKSGEQLGLF